MIMNKSSVIFIQRDTENGGSSWQQNEGHEKNIF